MTSRSKACVFDIKQELPPSQGFPNGLSDTMAEEHSNRKIRFNINIISKFLACFNLMG